MKTCIRAFKRKKTFFLSFSEGSLSDDGRPEIAPDPVVGRDWRNTGIDENVDFFRLRDVISFATMR